MKRSLAIVAASVIGVAGVMLLSASRAAQDELDPVKILPQYNTVVLENALVRVTEERMPPGVGIGKHFHRHGIVINMGNFQMEQKMYPGGEIVHSERHLGDIAWNEAMTHETKNVGSTPQWTVRVEVKVP